MNEMKKFFGTTPIFKFKSTTGLTLDQSFSGELLPPDGKFESINLKILKTKFTEEIQALNYCAKNVATPLLHKYGSISWPLVSSGGSVNNLKCFRFIRSIPIVSRSIQDSASEVADLMKVISRTAQEASKIYANQSPKPDSSQSDSGSNSATSATTSVPRTEDIQPDGV